ncbi:hypothetical protein [Streptomyces marispadix]|uniref:Secreted protein n=1 Tax=Streptomyces marispadix TaxID=2922868 RepID=A0ABS9SXD0_9ACTN|nr:hypothetical protein [Streptomyces marispadix]MCH6160915.1 hypothetical protein [Streptomyces marispadix]
MSRRLKLIAAVAVVLVAISGFSPGRKGGGYRGSSKGGGCSSSSSSSHNNSGSSYDSDTGGSSYGSDGSSYGRKGDYGSSGDSGYRSGTRRYHSTTGTTGSRHGSTRYGSASATVTRCAPQSGSEAKAEVEVRNPKNYTKTYTVTVEFLDESGTHVDSGSAEVEVGSRTTAPVDVRMAHPGRIGDVSECLVKSVD